MRHADADIAIVSLDVDDEAVVLSVSDDGKGMAADLPAETAGIAGMRERALLVGGELVTREARPRGTELRLWLPHRVRR